MANSKSTPFPATIRVLNAADVQAWIDGNVETRGVDEVPRLSRLWHEERFTVWAAWSDNMYLGHAAVVWQSEYDPFARADIPEILDVWVQPEHRQHGVARQLLHIVEEAMRQRGIAQLGLGVGVSDEFLPARRLYESLGFKPDGRGPKTQDDQVQTMWIKAL